MKAASRSKAHGLDGTWDVVALEVDGTTIPEGSFRGSGIVVKGNTFTTISMGATYGGTFTVDAAKRPHTLDLSFKSGPEKGNKSLAIYELSGDTWTICLTVSGKTRPSAFATKPGSGFALETLQRQTGASPRDRRNAELGALQGEWSLVACIKDGQEMPADFVKTGKRVVKGNETTVLFGTQVFLKAAFTVGASSEPKTIDYIVTAGEMQGEAQAGIYKIVGDEVTYYLAPPGQPRPAGFTTREGVGGTLTIWKRKRK
jgi:uncharacterized protein (TIGR03067 family)